MLKRYETKELKLNADLRGRKAGDIVRIKCIGGMPADQYWRRRLKDAQIDRCVEIIEKPKTVLKKKAENKADKDE